jgi:acyl-CoA thioesterase-1
MNPIVFHLASGHSFFTGIALVILAVFASRSQSRIAHRSAVVLFLIGVIGIVLSSTPVPYWLYGIAAIGTILWFVSAFVKSWRVWAHWVAIAGWLVLAVVEVRYQFLPRLKLATTRSMTVIGDSVTAGGVGGDEDFQRWPQIFQRDHNVAVQDISHMGDTARSALKRARKQQINAPLVFVEIGGNDVLGSTQPGDFAADLDALIAHVSTPGRQVVMLELPLLPFYHEYGRHQRRIAAKYGVALVPKRVFLSVLAGSGSTMDSIHLSQEGHRQMAETVWSLVGSAYPDLN